MPPATVGVLPTYQCNQSWWWSVLLGIEPVTAMELAHSGATKL